MQRIAEAWQADLQRILGTQTLTVTDVRIGIFFAAVRLSNGHAGVAFTPREANHATSPVRSAPSPAGTMAGQNAWLLAEWALSDIPLRRSVGVAVLNALSACAMAQAGISGGQLTPGMDALLAAGIRPQDRIGMVGAFIPFIKKLKGHAALTHNLL